MNRHAMAEARREVESWFTGARYQWQSFPDRERLERATYTPTAELQRLGGYTPASDSLDQSKPPRSGSSVPVKGQE